MTFRTALPAAVLAVGLAAAVAGCSSGSTSTTSSTGSTASTASAAASAQPGVVSNDADVTFLTDMYPHHAQAVTMADLVRGRSTNPALIALATTITGEQQPEMDTMASLLTSFGRPTPSTDSSAGGMDAGSMSGMSGMMSADDMTRLGTLSGTEFDRTWLTMMTAHHTGAVEMATTELADGANPDAKALATRITAAQNAEIATMKNLLAQL